MDGRGASGTGKGAGKAGGGASTTSGKVSAGTLGCLYKMDDKAAGR